MHEFQKEVWYNADHIISIRLNKRPLALIINISIVFRSNSTYGQNKQTLRNLNGCRILGLS